MKINWPFIVKVTAVLLILLILEFGCAQAAGAELPVQGTEYLQQIGADAETQAELTALWRGWES